MALTGESAFLSAIRSYLPDKIITNEELVHDFGGWSAAQIHSKLGIGSRRVVSTNECSSDLGVRAAQKLFDDGVVRPSEIDFLLFCTQSPDYILPTTACLIQDRLGLSTTCGALDFNLGCSGFIYGLSLAKGLIESQIAHTVLLITAETYSKFLSPGDQSTRTVFGDGASATVVVGREREATGIGPFVFGTDGKGGENIMVKIGGARYPGSFLDTPLHMNGPEVLNFTLREIPVCLHSLYKKADVQQDDIDFFVFHQANKFILELLRKKLKISAEKYCVNLELTGNTVSSTIPIALESSINSGVVGCGSLIALVGFGVGYSWGAVIVKLEDWR